jgi:hypothetical protein
VVRRGEQQRAQGLWVVGIFQVLEQVPHFQSTFNIEVVLSLSNSLGQNTRAGSRQSASIAVKFQAGKELKKKTLNSEPFSGAWEIHIRL